MIIFKLNNSFFQKKKKRKDKASFQRDILYWKRLVFEGFEDKFHFLENKSQIFEFHQKHQMI